ncbi:MAG: pyroglutamyl-peptidase I [Micrococcales bacterium]|nr:pyroglutamyl-peptidase I [Micrococcales bacterium]
MTTVLLTGFEPFGGVAENPSWTAVRQVAEEWDGEARVVAELLPVEFERASTALAAALERHRPDVVIATGFAQERRAVTPEWRAVNLDDARIPDNGGAQPRGKRIEDGGPDALGSTLPVEAIVAALDRVGIPAAASESAGAYVCNHLFYRLQRMTAGTPVRSGFIHVPPTPGTGLGESTPTIPAAMVTSAIRIAVATTLAEFGEAPFDGAAR